MALQQSILKLTHDAFGPGNTPRVLLDHGWWIDGPLKFPQRNGMEVVPTAESDYPLILDTLNSSFTLKFVVVDESPANKAASMANALNFLVTMERLLVKPLRIDVLGWTPGKYWRVEQCKVNEFEPWHDPNVKTPRTMRGYTLTCSGISYV